jgi:hypothetical protein
MQKSSTLGSFNGLAQVDAKSNTANQKVLGNKSNEE